LFDRRHVPLVEAVRHRPAATKAITSARCRVVKSGGLIRCRTGLDRTSSVTERTSFPAAIGVTRGGPAEPAMASNRQQPNDRFDSKGTSESFQHRQRRNGASSLEPRHRRLRHRGGPSKRAL